MSDAFRRAALSGILAASRPDEAKPMASIPPNRAAAGQPELKQALAECRSAFIAIGVFSAVINVLMLTGSIYMLQVYDRVIPSRSIPTLVGLTVVIVILFAVQGVLDAVRQRMLVRVGSYLDEKLSDRVVKVIMTMPLKTRAPGDGMMPIRDLDTIRAFLSSLGPTALFDLPWMPFYLFICFAFHPWLGWTAVGGAIVLAGVTWWTEIATRDPQRKSAESGSRRFAAAESARRNAEPIAAMGMGSALARRFGDLSTDHLAHHQTAADVTGGLGVVSKTVRMFLQSVVLGVGAYLVVHGDASPGIMIASSIVTSRALAPIELAIGHWRGFVASRQGWARLGQLLSAIPKEEDHMRLPAPEKALEVDDIAVVAPGGREIVVRGVRFRLQAGQGLGIIGPSAAGKSSLSRALVGVWPLARGSVRLDGATIDQYSESQRGEVIGYLPQDVGLFDGTVAENIARFADRPDPEAVVKAAKSAGAHDMILRLPDGYDTRIGEGGSVLSAGQRQRVGLARALYGDPFMVLLDEPNSNLDNDGEIALTQAIDSIRKRGGIAIVIAHRPSAIAAVDMVMVLANGEMQAFGPRDEVLKKTVQNAQAVMAGQPAGLANRAMQAVQTPPGAGAPPPPAAPTIDQGVAPVRQTQGPAGEFPVAPSPGATAVPFDFPKAGKAK